MVKQSQDQIVNQLMTQFLGQKTVLLAPAVKGRKGHYRELFVQIARLGYTKVRVDGEVQDIVPKMQLDRYKVHDIEIVIDRVVPKTEEQDPQSRYRLSQSVATAIKQGKGALMILDEKGETYYFSQNLMDPESGISYDDPAPNAFSFNSPYGWCPTCQGLGVVEEITEDSIIPDKN